MKASEVSSLVIFYCKDARALTFQNFSQGHGSRSGAGKKVTGTSIKADREVGREGITYAVPKGGAEPATAPAPAGKKVAAKATGSKPKHAALNKAAAQQDEDEWAAAFNGDNDEEEAQPPGHLVLVLLLLLLFLFLFV